MAARTKARKRALDILYAAEMGYRIKLLGVASRSDRLSGPHDHARVDSCQCDADFTGFRPV